MPPGTLPAPSDRDRLLVTAFHSPVTAAPSRSIHSGVKVPGLLLRSPAARPRRPFGLLAPPHFWFAPESGGFAASIPLQRLRAVHPAAPVVSTPLQDCYILRDQSVQPLRPPDGPPSESARFPIAPRSPHLLLEHQLRIIVPGPLRFRRLAVPQTSWNLIYYAPELAVRQCLPDYFQQSILTVFLVGYRHPAVHFLLIKRCLEDLF